MLPKKERVSRTLFTEHFKKGRFLSFNSFTLRISRDPSFKKSRFSFVVSGKVSKKAIERNKLRRRGYSAIQKNKEGIKPGFAGLFFIKKEALKLDFSEFDQEILLALKKAGIYEKNID